MNFHTTGQLSCEDRSRPAASIERAFYAEQGGQVGDQGTIRTPTGLVEVTQTVKVGNATAHFGQVGTVRTGRIEVGPEPRRYRLEP